jgi:hypothetical protein
MGDIPFKCEICQGLQNAGEEGKFDDWATSTPFTSLQSQSVRCSGPCVPIWTGVKQLVSTNAALNTSELRIGGGLGSSSVLRLLGSHDFQSTFDVEFFTEKACNTGASSVESSSGAYETQAHHGHGRCSAKHAMFSQSHSRLSAVQGSLNGSSNVPTVTKLVGAKLSRHLCPHVSSM